MLTLVNTHYIYFKCKRKHKGTDSKPPPLKFIFNCFKCQNVEWYRTLI